MLSVNHLSKNYGSEKVVQSVSFELGHGEVFCLLGSNGAGKSTTIKMLLGLIPASSGNATLFGDNLLVSNSDARQAIFYVPENVTLYDDLSALENIEYLAAVSGTTIDAHAVSDALRRAGLNNEHHQQRLKQFSKGMRQKVIIAFALVRKTQLLVLDEPTSGLDPLAIRDFVAVIETLKNAGCGVLMVTHDLQCAHLLADRVGVMHQGQLKTIFSATDIQLTEIEKIYFGQLKNEHSNDEH